MPSRPLMLSQPRSPHPCLIALALTLIAALALAGCVEPEVTPCDDLLCPSGTQCDGNGRCVADLAVAACESKPEGAVCSVTTGTRPFANGRCLPAACVEIGCGTEIIDEAAGEVCADTNRENGDGCSADCKSNETCGNGVIDQVKGESCDDGNTENGDGCQANCVVPTCGDSVTDVQFNEVCDQGGLNSDAPGAACRPNCQPQRCGDGVIDPGEVCDDGNSAAGDGCTPDCQSNETCGNNIVDFIAGESCDDGNTDNGDGCYGNCRRCGDGILEEAQGEVCDDGNLAAGDGCTPDCQSTEVCGNDIVDFFAGEQCDDANGRTHDGCHHSCLAEQPTWSEPAPQMPSPRLSHAMAYVSRHQNTVMFGGWAFTSGLLGDTWTWDGNGWSLRRPEVSPSARSSHAMAYDAHRQRVVLFGGWDGAALGDTWEWDGFAWAAKTPAAAPSPRAGHAMTYDAGRQRVVLFGGGDNETWEWDGVTWLPLATPTLPPARAEHAMAYDAALGYIVMFGGQGAGWQPLGDTWIFEGGDWRPAGNGPFALFLSPAGAQGHVMSYDSDLARVVMAGLQYEGNVYAYTPSGWEWLSAAPAERTDAAMVFDAAQRELILFGGDAFAYQYNDLWRGRSGAWALWQPDARPAPRASAAMAFDAKRQVMVMHGGYGYADGLRDETWELRDDVWRRVDFSPREFPCGDFTCIEVTIVPSMESHSMAYLPALEKVVSFGGYNGNSLSDTTWLFDGVSWQKSQQVTRPLARSGAGMVYHASLGDLVLFGGDANFGTQPLADTWRFNGSQWSQVITATSPTARRDPLMAYDARLDRTVLFGGYGLSDTWVFDGAEWQALPAAGGPGEPGDAIAYDSQLGQVILVAGTTTWALRGEQWFELATIARPANRFWSASAYDEARRQLRVFGGLTRGQFSDFSNETWGFQFAVPGELEAEACRGEAAGVDADGDGLAGCDDPDCGGLCDPLCLPLTSCAPDRERCGDGVCTAARENWANCAVDCESSTCGDGVCGSEENVASCAADCFVCGDLVCSAPHETNATCAVDCP